MIKFENVTTADVVAIYEASHDVFDGLLSEIRELSKKKPDATLSKNKVKLLNRVLEDIQSFLKSEPEGKYLDLLDDEELPQNSDAVLVMVQYEKSLGAFERRYQAGTFGNTYWVTEEKIRALEEVNEHNDEFEEDYEE